jgi:hypothetical protein
MQGVCSKDSIRQKKQSPIFVPISYNFRENVQNRFVGNLRPDVCSFFCLSAFISQIFFTMVFLLLLDTVVFM